MSELNVYQRINAVMKEVSYVKKDANVQGYKAVTHDQVTAALRKMMVKFGIVIRLEQLTSEVIERKDKEKNINMLLYSGTYNVHFVNIDKPEDFLTVTMCAHAADNGDKAPGKAASYATKYAMLKLFSLETGENDESRAAETSSHSDLQKDMFDDLLAKKDGIGLASFEQTVGHDIMISLNGSFQKGKISEGKAAYKSLVSEGWEEIRGIAADISALIEKQDPAVVEITEELTAVEKKLVATQLSPTELQYLRSMNT